METEGNREWVRYKKVKKDFFLKREKKEQSWHIIKTTDAKEEEKRERVIKE